MARYSFSVGIAGTLDPATDRPMRETWTRRCDSDAQAEKYARRLSEDRRRAWVQIARAGATWGLRAPTEG